MQLVIITGLSGAGKSQAVNALEDIGYYCIDNMPPALIKNFTELAGRGKASVEKAAFVVDVRGGSFFDAAKEQLAELKRSDGDVKIIFLEADKPVLIRRYNETRRTHPLDVDSVEDGIEKEVELLSEIRDMADYVIDTSGLKPSMLHSEITAIVNGEREKEVFTVNFKSFGYKYGIPLDADLVFDMRFIPNPYYVASLRDLTGNNRKIREYVMKYDITHKFIDQASILIKDMIPGYIAEGKYHLNIAFGCTGGHHRSVAMANIFAESFGEEGIRTTLSHRDLG